MIIRTALPVLSPILFGLALAGCVSDPGTVAADASTPDTSVSPEAGPDSALPQDGAVQDSSTVDASDSSSPTVKSVPGLVLWLDGTKGVTADANGLVSKWADQSGNGNDAVQATMGSQPLLVAQGINNKPSLRFTTNPNGPYPNLGVADSATLQLGTGDFYIGAVVRWSNAGSLGMIVSKQLGVSPFAGYAMYMNFTTASHAGGQLDANNNVGSATGSLNDNVARQYAFVRTGGTASIRLNGSSDGTLPSTMVNSDAVGSTLSIGGLSGSGLHPLQGDIAEIVIVKGSITPANETFIEGYFKTKYAL